MPKEKVTNKVLKIIEPNHNKSSETVVEEKDILSKQNSLLTVLVFALIPYHVFISSFAVLEPAMLFFISIATYFILRVYLENKTRDFILSGIFVGLACSVKYNAIFTVFPFVVANILYFYNGFNINLKIQIYET